jgi:hypothetical protein
MRASGWMHPFQLKLTLTIVWIVNRRSTHQILAFLVTMTLLLYAIAHKATIMWQMTTALTIVLLVPTASTKQIRAMQLRVPNVLQVDTWTQPQGQQTLIMIIASTVL